MIKIKYNIIGKEFIECIENKCKYKKKCANHESAGDFRVEGGLTPDLKLVRFKLHCNTYLTGKGIHSPNNDSNALLISNILNNSRSS